MICRVSFYAGLLTLYLCGNAYAQLRIVNYNVAGLNNSSAVQTVLDAIRAETINGVAKPIDVLVLNEVESADVITLLGMLNGKGFGTYAAGNLGTTTGAGSVGLIYRSDTVFLAAQQQVVNTSASGAARGVMRYTLRPGYYDESANFYIYASHYKAGDTTSDRNRRNVEAAAIRSNSNALGEGAHVIYTGDFNIYRSTEPMWATLTAEQGGAANNGRGFDPVDEVGNWHDEDDFKAVHTQNPAGSGGVGGGMDDRFDWQLLTAEFMDDEGLSIIPGSYRAFGNNNTHSMNGHINTGTGASPTVLNALGNASDHLPVVAQYRVPARIQRDFVIPSRVIVGASASAEVTISNSAGDLPIVMDVNGADELDYTLTATGAASGSASGTDAAFGGGNVHAFALDTASTGSKSGGIESLATSPQVTDAQSIYLLGYSVVDHANPSFSSNSDVNTLTHDFGTVSLGAAAPTFDYTLKNLLSTAGFTSDLDYDGCDIVGVGDSFRLGIGESWTPLDAGFSRTYTASMLTDSAGAFNATLELLFSDEDVPGEASHSLFLTLTGNVVAGLAGDFDNDGDVDGRDFLFWQRNPNVGNLSDWQTNYGAGSIIVNIAVPEPSSLLLCVAIAGLALLTRLK